MVKEDRSYHNHDEELMLERGGSPPVERLSPTEHVRGPIRKRTRNWTYEHVLFSFVWKIRHYDYIFGLKKYWR